MQEIEDIGYRVHWIAFTVHAPSDQAFIIYDLLFKEHFGALEPLGHGGRGFKEIHHSLLEFKIYTYPVMGNGDYWHYEIPGSACDVIDWDYLLGLGDLLESNFKDQYKFTRLDFAFDNVPFTPQQVEQAIRDDEIRSLGKRETLQVHASPFAAKDNGDLGTYTVEFGSRTSERMIRVYDKRGFTRLEFEMKDRRAQLVATQIFTRASTDQWYFIVLAHLLDYIEFKTDWWKEFVDKTERARATVTTPKEISMSKTVQWIEKQVAPALSVLVDVLPEATIDGIIKRGRQKRGPRYNLLLGKFS